MREHVQRARAFVFAAQEDFGIAPVEAQVCGTPVIAYGSGGAAETVRGLQQNPPTGVLFEEQTVEGCARRCGSLSSTRRASPGGVPAKRRALCHWRVPSAHGGAGGVALVGFAGRGGSPG